MALEITDATFDEVVLKSDKPVLVDFWAAWCGPCRMVGPIIEDLSKDYDGKAVVGKVDVDANQEFAAKYGVRNIPTVLVFDKGELVGRHVGVSPKKHLRRSDRRGFISFTFLLLIVWQIQNAAYICTRQMRVW
jgi:thioredoxin 1